MVASDSPPISPDEPIAIKASYPGGGPHLSPDLVSRGHRHCPGDLRVHRRVFLAYQSIPTLHRYGLTFLTRKPEWDPELDTS